MATNEEMYDEADKLKDAGKLDEAAAKLDALLAQAPDYALAHSAMAVICTKLKRHDEAIKHALRTCELEPEDAFSFTALSVTFQRAGKIPEAEDAMARARMIQGGHHH
jgi:predicted Zn-dependent protease